MLPVSPAAAKNLSLRDGAPALSFVLPDAWKPSDTNSGWEATSDDGDVYVSVEDAKNIGDDLHQLMKANGKWVDKNNIDTTGPTTHDRDYALNFMQAHEIVYDAVDNALGLGDRARRARKRDLSSVQKYQADQLTRTCHL